MPTPVRHLLIACGLAVAAAALSAPAVCADAEKPVKANKPAAKPKKGPVAPAEPEEPEPDLADTTSTEYQCELNNKVTIYHNDNDSDHIALRWNKRLHRLTRVSTTTGANRFENAKFGLTWIGIPAKGMLLDSRLNRQLANECKNAEQAGREVAQAQQARKS